MTRTRCFSLLLLLFLTAAAGCGDKVESTAVSAIDAAPTVIFFDDTSPANLALLTGTADDGVRVTKVEVSCDNGLTWRTASLPGGTGQHVAWSFTMSRASVPAAYYILLRATNSAGNLETQHLVASGTMAYSATPEMLKTIIQGAGAGAVVLLSSGEKGAYHFSLAGAVAPPSGLILVGAEAVESSPLPPTLLSAGPSVGRLFSVSAPFALRGVRLKGARVGIGVTAGAPLAVEVKDCRFESHGNWAITAVGTAATAESVVLALSGVVVNCSGSLFGGVHAEKANLSLFDCALDNLGTTAPLVPPAGAVSLVSASSSTWIDSCLFTNNGFAINASSTYALITSCKIDGAAAETNGIRLNGKPASSFASSRPRLRHNQVINNGGFGVAILGSTTPVLSRNLIKNNGVAPSGNGLGGIYIKGKFPGPQFINLGNLGDPTSGYNSFITNKHNGSLTSGNIYVDDGTTGLTIQAQNNWWQTVIIPTIETTIRDAGDLPGLPQVFVGLDYPGPGSPLGSPP